MSDEGIGPPAGQEGPPAPPPPGPPSEFNTPVIAPHPVDVEGEAAPAVDTIAPARRTGRFAALLVFAVLVAIAAAVLAATIAGHAEGEATAPSRPHAKAAACGPPRCDRLRTTVTLTWAASGSGVSSYTIERNGKPLSAPGLDERTTSFTDDTAVFGSTYDYVVVAHDDSGSVASSPPVHVRVPLPPVSAAQLDGSYDVRLTVSKASNLGALEGIKHPRPGDGRSTRWTFLVGCSAPQGACSTRWETFGTIRPSGRIYTGSFSGARADCHPGTAPIHFSMHLTVQRARAAWASWLVTAFQGTYTVTFSCPGGTSIGSLRVTGRAA